jgi:hypothetical protein
VLPGNSGKATSGVGTGKKNGYASGNGNGNGNSGSGGSRNVGGKRGLAP